MRRRVFVCFLLAAQAATALQRTSDPAQLVAQGEQLVRAAKSAAARPLLTRAVAVAAAQKNARALAQARLWLGIALENLNHRRAADAALQAAAGEFAALGDPVLAARAQLALGTLRAQQGQSAAAHRLWLGALAVFVDHHATLFAARTYWNLAYDASATEAQRLAWTLRGLPLAQQAAAGHDPEALTIEGGLWESYGDQLYSRGNYAAAIDKIDRAIACFRAAGNQDQLAYGYTSLGQLLGGHGDTARSRALFIRALDLQRRIGDRHGVLQSRFMIAQSDLDLGRNRRALTEFRELLAWARTFAAPPILAALEGRLGEAYLSVGEPARARRQLLEALSHATDSRARPLCNLAEAELRLGHPAAAQRAAAEAVGIARQAKNRLWLYRSLDWLARSDTATGDSVAALADADRALAAVEDLRAHLIPADRLKRDYVAMTRQTYDFAVGLNASYGRAARALEVAEAARARAFSDLLASRNLAAPLAAREALQPSDTAALASAGAIAPISLAEASRLTAALGVTTLAYWSSPNATWIWTLALSGRLLAARSPLGRAAIARLVAAASAPPGPADLRPTSATAPSPRRRALAALYRALIAPVRSSLPARGSLLIVPDGPLFDLPFAALLAPGGRYLIERHALSYAPSLTSLRLVAAIPKSVAPRLLLVADPRLPALPNVGRLAPLPGARSEAAAVARLAPPGDATLLVGRAAERSAVLRRMQSGAYSAIHFATHALVRNGDPLASFIALGGASPAAAELTAAQIYRLHLDADLVFLSACRTAAGPVTGDGRAGLTRAFFYAGTSSVVASLWDVADAPTGRLVAAFYRHYLRGDGKAASLAAAQRELLAALRAGKVQVQTTDGGRLTLPPSPIFWAAFVLAGQP